MANEKDMLVNPERTWINSRTMWAVVAILATGTFLVASFISEMRNAVSTIKETISRDARIHEQDRDQIVSSIREVRDELRKMVTDSVATRQAQQWIDTFRLLNKAKFPELQVPDLPR